MTLGKDRLIVEDESVGFFRGSLEVVFVLPCFVHEEVGQELGELGRLPRVRNASVPLVEGPFEIVHLGVELHGI